MFDIIADSACDFTPEMAQKMGVEIVPFYVSLDGEHYRKEGKEIAVRDFYQFMVDNPSAYPKTSLAPSRISRRCSAVRLRPAAPPSASASPAG